VNKTKLFTMNAFEWTRGKREVIKYINKGIAHEKRMTQYWRTKIPIGDRLNGTRDILIQREGKKSDLSSRATNHKDKIVGSHKGGTLSGHNK